MQRRYRDQTNQSITVRTPCLMLPDFRKVSLEKRLVEREKEVELLKGEVAALKKAVGK
jgi:hypothetical protein